MCGLFYFRCPANQAANETIFATYRFVVIRDWFKITFGLKSTHHENISTQPYFNPD